MNSLSNLKDEFGNCSVFRQAWRTMRAKTKHSAYLEDYYIKLLNSNIKNVAFQVWTIVIIKG